MPESVPLRGGCLCGSIRYEAREIAGPMAHCHCGMCRKAHGAAFSTVLPVTRAGFRWLAGDAELASYESMPGKRRWFCSRCGSQLISTRDADDQRLLVRAGSLDGDPGCVPVAHGWVGSKAAWDSIDDDLPRFERGFPGAPPGPEDVGVEACG